jgi:hypothetical protein
MYVIDHKECGNGASFYRIRIHRSSAVPSGIIFDVNMLLCKTDGSRIAAYRFQIDRGKRREQIFRAIGTVSVVRNDDRAPIRDGVNGGLQKIFLAEKRSIKHRTAQKDEKYAEEPECTADGSARIRAANSSAMLVHRRTGGFSSVGRARSTTM